MVGDRCYEMMREVKKAFDPHGIFNPGKITDRPPMDEFHRYGPGHPTRDYETVFDFSNVMGVLRAAEKCNGSGDCRKTHLTGGTMCPSYMATRNEKDSTRGRANVLRHILTDPPDPRKPFANDEVLEVMDLCLSCKGCKAECPSNVDIAKLKAEFLQHYYDANGVPFRARVISRFADAGALASVAPWAWNAVYRTPALRRIANRVVGFHPERTIPLLGKTTLRRWLEKRTVKSERSERGKVYFFCDEFTNYNDVEIGIAAIELLEGLGYEVIALRHPESGRASMSKGLLRRARKFAQANVGIFGPVVSEETPLVGIEPSAILSFRDEYPDLLRGEEQKAAKRLAPHTYLIDEFIARESDAGRIRSEQFHEKIREIALHGHCHQKALASQTPTVKMLQLPKGHKVRLIPSGCCGMAGSFGYEAEHYELSMQIGELVLFPRVRDTPTEVTIASAGTSCRHQILDGTGRESLHPVQILREALIE